MKSDVVIIGGGPGGYVAAIRAAQLGMRVAVVERDKVGGVCLNYGCIPTKALLRNAEIVNLIKRGKEFGITFDNVRFNFKEAVKRSQRAAQRLSKGVEFLLKKNQITLIPGAARLLSAKRLVILGEGGVARDEVQAERVILATGSRPKLIPGVEVDGRRVITSTEALLLDEAPRSMAIIGAGAVGVEFADIYNAYGTEVTLIEMMPRILPLEDAEISEILAKAFSKKGIRVMTSTRVEGIDVEGAGATVRVSRDGRMEQVRCDTLLVAIGRAPNIEEIGLEEVGVELENGFIKVNERFETSTPGIYAIGDVVGQPLLAHAAMAEGIAAVEGMAGMEASVNYRNIPSCTYCHPQVASIGLTEEKAIEQGYKVKVGRFPLIANGKAICMGEPEGMVKVVAEARTGEILGVHIIGAEATELIAEAGLAKALEATPLEVALTVHAHPTMSEALAEASLAALDRAIHI